MIIIVDLDGTLYDASNRNHLAQAGLWDDFHRASTTDNPNHDVRAVVDALQEAGHTLLGVTGRNERYRPITLSWLMRWQIHLDDLLMRPDDNFTSDAVIKVKLVENWLAEHAMDRREVLLALEDRDKMVDAWRNWGIPCHQVRPGGY